ASGDHHPRDGHVDTFDVLYPNLGYFTDAPLFYPGNTRDLQPKVTLHFASNLSLQAGTDVIHRLSRSAAVYAPPGFPLIRGDGTGSLFVSSLAYAKVDWHLVQHWDVVLEVVHGSIGSLIASKDGRNANYGLAQASFQF